MKEPFYDRHTELQFFRDKYKELKKGELIIFYGRRRLGKTRLIKFFLEEIEGKKLYSFVNIREEKELMEDFAKNVLEMTGDTLKIDRWSTLFDYLHEEGKKSKFVLVIDEFQRLKSLAPGFISELQNYWDSKLKNTQVMLVLIGSSIGMMKQLAFSAAGALYGRKTAAMQLNPFRYVDFREMFSNRTEEEKIAWYSVFGGTPHYLEQVYKLEGLHEAILKTVLEKNAVLREETRNLLEFELRATARYNSILHAISQGKENIKEISDTTKISPVALPQYLDKLMNLLNLVEKREPLFGKKKSSKYVLSDNFFKFWYRFVFPNQSPLELGNTKFVSNKINTELNGYVGQIFENIVRELFKLYNGNMIKDVSLNFTQIGSWWDRASHEIDLVIKNQNELILGEVKYTNDLVDAGLLNDLMEKTKFINYNGRIKYVLVAKNGFTESCKAFAAKINATLLTLKDVEQLFAAVTTKHIERGKNSI